VRSCLIPPAVLGACLVLTHPAPAQPEQEPANGRMTVSIHLTPRDYPRPASRVFLLPEFAESIQGNRVQMFLRCFMEQDNFFGKTETNRREAWNQMALADLPLAEVRDYGGRLLSRDMYDAARMTYSDWQLWYFTRRDGYRTLLPDVQKMRSLASALKTRVRGEIAAGDCLGAIHDLKTFLGLARTMEAHPTMIGGLVGTAIAMIAVSTVEELIQQPGCPNLFWALTDLPVPFMSLRASIEGERSFISSDFADLKAAADPVADSAIEKKIDSYEELFKMQGDPENPLARMPGGLKALFQARARDAGEVKAARQRLIQYGLEPAHVAVWTPLHVVAIEDVMVYEEYRDEMGKWLNLPYWKAKGGLAEADAAVKKMLDRSAFTWSIAAVMKLKNAMVRLDQRIAYLQIMEALRLHAFRSGALPATLAELKLPLPLDPVTGKPFEYTVKDGVATLHGENPMAGNPRTNRYYEISLKK
jgi:hypothetical protein